MALRLFLLILFILFCGCPRDYSNPKVDTQSTIEPEDEFDEQYKIYPQDENIMKQTLKETKEELTSLDGGKK